MKGRVTASGTSRNGQSDRDRRPRALRPADRWMAMWPPGIILVQMAVVFFLVMPRTPPDWSYQVLLLCLLAAAGAGRALMGYRRSAEGAPLPRWWRHAVYPLIAGAAVLTYLPGLKAGFVADDYILAQAMSKVDGLVEALQSPVFKCFYRPGTLFFWWAGARLWDGASLGYNALSIVLHATNALLVYWVGRRLMGSDYGGAAAALVFAVHPLHVEPVLSPACLSDPLATMFCLLSLLSLEWYLGGRTRAERAAALVCALAAFLLALLNKEPAAALPGFVLLRLGLWSREVGPKRAMGIVGAYALTLIAYAAMRVSALGELGGYSMTLTFWNTAFPSQPLRQIGVFFFPVHRGLFETFLHPWFMGAAMAMMAWLVLWCLGGLAQVPGRRLWLWVGYVFVMAVPLWFLPYYVSGHFQDIRFTYLPTVGLAWLFGDICAGYGWGWRRSGAVLTAAVIGAAALTVWYITPWWESDRIAKKVMAETERVVAELPEARGRVVLYAQDIPREYLGAPVFMVGYPEAVAMRLGEGVVAYSVARIGDAPGGEFRVPIDELDAMVLTANECVAVWDEESERLEVVRRGELPPSAGFPEGPR